jgi:hypothetical protein
MGKVWFITGDSRGMGVDFDKATVTVLPNGVGGKLYG